MITELLAALAAIPKIADSLDRLTESVVQLNVRAAKARAASRRTRKDKDVEDRIAGLTNPTDGLPEREAGE